MENDNELIKWLINTGSLKYEFSLAYLISNCIFSKQVYILKKLYIYILKNDEYFVDDIMYIN